MARLLSRSTPISSALSPSAIAASFRAVPGLHLHIPFYDKLYPFRPYNKVIYQPDQAQAYFAALQREAERYTTCFGQPLRSLAITGGAPTLGLSHLERIIAQVSIEGARSIEVLPHRITAATVAQLRTMGITQISLDIQSFNADILRRLGDPHTSAEGWQALELCQGQFECVHVDLLFDVSLADEDVFFSDVEACFEAGVDQISVHPLMRIAYAPFGKIRPNRPHEHAVLRLVEEMAAEYGYERLSVWTFKKQGSPAFESFRRNPYLGIGAGAASFTGTQFLVNQLAPQQYIAQIEAGRLPVARRVPLSMTKAALYYLFWQAYTGPIDLESFGKLFPRAGNAQQVIELALKWGYLEREGSTARLTSRGYDRYYDLERWVTQHLTEPLWKALIVEHGANEVSATPISLGMTDRMWLRLMGV